MSDENQNNELVTYLCTHAFQTEALLKAQNVILNSLIKVVLLNKLKRLLLAPLNLL